MNLLNNWLIQAILGNVAWILFCRIIKNLKTFLKTLNENNSKQNSSNSPKKLYSKKLLKNQFNICFKVSSISTISLLVILANNLQYQFFALFILLIIFVFFSYILMLGSFEGSLERFDD